MPWGWSAPKEGTDLGGAIGTYAEAKQTGAWPDYEAMHLAKKLTHQVGPLIHGQNLNDTEKVVYLDKVTEDYKEEAERCLKVEFNQWLQGTHSDNAIMETYHQGKGKPRRRHVYDGNQPYNDNEWQPTWWGNNSLTHLPGVREYLRSMSIAEDKAEFDMNVLAEHGPQNLEQAWAYFKHWVKGRPISDDCMLYDLRNEEGIRSDIGTELPGGAAAYPKRAREGLDKSTWYGGDPPQPYNYSRNSQMAVDQDFPGGNEEARETAAREDIQFEKQIQLLEQIANQTANPRTPRPQVRSVSRRIRPNSLGMTPGSAASNATTMPMQESSIPEWLEKAQDRLDASSMSDLERGLGGQVNADTKGVFGRSDAERQIDESSPLMRRVSKLLQNSSPLYTEREASVYNAELFNRSSPEGYSPEGYEPWNGPPRTPHTRPSEIL